MVFTISYGASGKCRSFESMTTVPSGLNSAVAPMLRINLSMVATSCRRGMFFSVTGPAVSSAAHSSGSAAFLAPEMRTSPFSGRPPRIRSLSMDLQWGWACHSAGVNVFIDKACTSSVCILAPSVA